jgi:2-polyprenyl-3-methyl-5-hydroxy-6-metoxy-1,4-benzoquinol methylase
LTTSSVDLRQFYEEQTDNEIDRAAEIRFQKAVWLAAVQPGTTVLDVGMRYGELRRFLPDVDYEGIDISSKRVEYCIRKGLKAKLVNVDDRTDYNDGTFDYVFALEIIEHVPHPWDFVSELKRILKPNGTLILSTPNPFYYIEFINYFRAHQNCDVGEHISCWTPHNMVNLLRFLGMKIEATCGTYAKVPKLDLFLPVNGVLSCSFIYRITSGMPLC